MGVRIVSGGVLIALVLVAIWVRGPLLLALVALAAALSAHEFYTVVRRAGFAPWYSAGIALSLLLSVRGYLGGDPLNGVPTVAPGQAADKICHRPNRLVAHERHEARRGRALFGARHNGRLADSTDG